MSLIQLAPDFYASMVAEMNATSVASRVIEDYSQRFGIPVRTLWKKANVFGYSSGKYGIRAYTKIKQISFEK